MWDAMQPWLADSCPPSCSDIFFFNLSFSLFFQVIILSVLRYFNECGMIHLIRKYEITDINNILYFKSKSGKAVSAILINSLFSQGK